MEVCLRLGVVQITPYVQPALIAPYSSTPKFPGGRAGPLWSISGQCLYPESPWVCEKAV